MLLVMHETIVSSNKTYLIFFVRSFVAQTMRTLMTYPFKMFSGGREKFTVSIDFYNNFQVGGFYWNRTICIFWETTWIANLQNKKIIFQCWFVLQICKETFPFNFMETARKDEFKINFFFFIQDNVHRPTRAASFVIQNRFIGNQNKTEVFKSLKK